MTLENGSGDDGDFTALQTLEIAFIVTNTRTA